MGSNLPVERPDFLERIATPEPGKDNEERTASRYPIAAMSVGADQTEDPPADEERIEVTVNDQSGNRTAYKIKYTIPMVKLIDHYHKANGREPGFFRFFHDGLRILEDDTPKKLGMGYMDSVDAMVPQIGGAKEEINAPFNPVDSMPIDTDQTEAPLAAVDNKTYVVVQDQGGNRMEFLLKRTLPLARLMKYYHEATGRRPGFLRFHFEGLRISETDSPESLDMKDYDLLDAMFPQEGGAIKEQTALFDPVGAHQTKDSALADEKEIHITVNDQSGDRIEFHFKSTLSMANLRSYYHEAPPSKCQGVRPSKRQEVRPSKCHGAPSPVENKTNITVLDSAGKRMAFVLRRNLPLAKLMTYYNNATGHGPGFYRFHFEGRRVVESDTPESLEMMDYETLDAMSAFCGAGPGDVMIDPADIVL